MVEAREHFSPALFKPCLLYTSTPFLLAAIKDMTHGVSLASNLELAYNNARVAARIAVAYCK